MTLCQQKFSNIKSFLLYDFNFVGLQREQWFLAEIMLTTNEMTMLLIEWLWYKITLF